MSGTMWARSRPPHPFPSPFPLCKDPSFSYRVNLATVYCYVNNISTVARRQIQTEDLEVIFSPLYFLGKRTKVVTVVGRHIGYTF